MIAKAPHIPKEKLKQANNKKFHALDEDGMARIGESLNSGDIFINKQTPVMTDN